MLNVLQVAKRSGTHPETIRRWIREGKLPARKIGRQHVIEEKDLGTMVPDDVLPGFSGFGGEIVTSIRRRHAAR